MQLFQCEDAVPPTRKTSSVTKLGRINCTDVPESSLESYQNLKGKNFSRVNFEVRMVPSGASVEFAVLVDGQILGAENAVIRFE